MSASMPGLKIWMRLYPHQTCPVWQMLHRSGTTSSSRTSDKTPKLPSMSERKWTLYCPQANNKD
eukprot:3872675-Amphidinium_carterae.1